MDALLAIAEEEAESRSLIAAPRESNAKCYKCSRPAEWVKRMKTPSGGHYYGGFCSQCLAGKRPMLQAVEAQLLDAASGRRGRKKFTTAKNNGDARVPIGAEVTVTFEAVMVRRLGPRYEVAIVDERGMYIGFRVPAEAVESLRQKWKPLC